MPAMRLIEPNMPSFTSVVLYEMYPLRLPEYRVSHVLRYSPYARVSLTKREVIQKEAVINKEEEQHQGSGASAPAQDIAEIDESSVAQAIYEAVHGNETMQRPTQRPRDLMIAVIDLALAVGKSIKLRDRPYAIRGTHGPITIANKN